MTANPTWGPGWALSEIAKSEDTKDKDIKPLAKLLSQKCENTKGDENPGVIAYQNMGGQLGEFADDEGIKGVWYLGLNGTLARSNYGYLTQTPLTKSEVSKTKYKVQGFGGWIFPSGNASLTGWFSYARTFTPGEDVELCAPNGVGSQIQCFTGALGAPVQSDRYTVGGEARVLFALGRSADSAKIGIAPTVSYEVKSDAFYLELPVYLAPAKDGKRLNGGVRMAYDTSKDDFAIGLFVGVPFSIFFN